MVHTTKLLLAATCIATCLPLSSAVGQTRGQGQLWQSMVPGRAKIAGKSTAPARRLLANPFQLSTMSQLSANPFGLPTLGERSIGGLSLDTADAPVAAPIVDSAAPIVAAEAPVTMSTTVAPTTGPTIAPASVIIAPPPYRPPPRSPYRPAPRPPF
ncbi:MAG: hypothetical protein KF688_16255 [Pirellulales bacterium]|nr:hypothetical protein [Pirellulales bacterium]